ncbi:MAG TPA: LLM class flavin-dependent oxidoreductase [Streptosporangiaceae bacterium]|jgi:F420-dependent oxidoreductase-like protein|nr:LLM class flavin-dependent oxidoreductase [Streptosporangiaceae bacterium]
MQVGIAAHVSSPDDAAFVRDAERLGATSAWVAEAWGQDALTPLAYLAAHTEEIALGSAIAQLGARTPAMLAMSAMSLQQLSGGRFRLGIGTSGPQVMEGWHGVRFTAPLAATRETIEIVRSIARGDRVTHDGQVFQLPLPGGPGRALRSMLPPVPVPIYVAALGPRNLELTGELADGWIGNAFMPEHGAVFLDRLAAGAAAAGRRLDELDLVIPVSVEITDDAEEAGRRHARGYAFTIGAMGSRDQNFYNAAFTRQGYGDDVRAVQELWLAGRRDEAGDRVPLELGSHTNLLGPPPTIRERLRRYRDAGITTLQAKLAGDARARLDTLAQLVDLVAEVSAELPPGPAIS